MEFGHQKALSIDRLMILSLGRKPKGNRTEKVIEETREAMVGFEEGLAMLTLSESQRTCKGFEVRLEWDARGVA